MEDQAKGASELEHEDKTTDTIEGQVQSDLESTGTENTVVDGHDRDKSAEESKDITGELEQSDEVEIDTAIIEKLTHGVLEMFLPNLQKAKGSLNEVLHNQEVLIETIQQENSKFTESASLKQLIQTMHEAKVYHGKLLNLKKEMAALMDKSTKMKRRAVKLQQQKQKDELTRADQMEREQERERMLTAKVAKSTTKKQNT